MKKDEKKDIKIWLINEHEWFLRKEVKNNDDTFLIFYSNWICPDGDAVSLYIKDTKEPDGGFVLECFSGIPASKINFDAIDFSHIVNVKGFPKEGFWEVDYLRKCLMVADFICSKFCEYYFINSLPSQEG